MDFSSLQLDRQQVKDLAEFVRDYNPYVSYSLYVDPNKEIDPLGSRLGGVPYWNFSVKPKVPYNSKGKIMRFIGQINIDDIDQAGKSRIFNQTNYLLQKRELLPESGLLQFFATADCSLGVHKYSPNRKAHSYEVVYWPEIPSEDLSVTFDELTSRFESQHVPLGQISNCCVSEYDWPIRNQIALNVKAIIVTPWESDADTLIACLRQGFKKVLGQNICIRSGQQFGNMMTALRDNQVSREISRISGIVRSDTPLLIGSILGRPLFIEENPFEDFDGAREQYDTTLLVLLNIEQQTVYSKTKGHKRFSMLTSEEANQIFSVDWDDFRHANFFIPRSKLECKDFSDTFLGWSQ